MAKVVKRIEIRVPKNSTANSPRKNKVIHFLVPPSGFLLKNNRRDMYLDYIDLENSR